MTQAIKYHGGKYYLSKQIVEIINRVPHIHYVETHCGGASVLFEKEPSASEVINDIDSQLTNFWQVLQDVDLFEQFKRIVDATPFSEIEWSLACDLLENWVYNGPDVKAAVAYFVRVRQSRQGIQKSFATLSRNRSRRGMNEQASSWASSIEDLAETIARLRGVVIFNKDARQVISSQDGPNTLFYIDPPYHPQTRTAKKVYRFEMSEKDHEDLLADLMDVEGKFILSGYLCPVYDQVATVCGWNRIDIPIPNHSSGDSKKEIKVESLWTNF